MNSDQSVLIVGGGLAGLCCALKLQEAGVACQIIEADSSVGGRVKTESYQGYLLDHGFQVLLTAYPEAKNILDYDRLQLRPFTPGALIRFRGKFHTWIDPRRRPKQVLRTLLSPVASVWDKLRVALLSLRLKRLSLDQIHSRPETDTLSYLYRAGFSQQIVQRFFKPFLGGVFLESDLQTTSRKFEFVFRMFGEGDAAVPANGMGAIPEQLASRLKDGSIRLDSPVRRIVDSTSVELASGEQIQASKIVLACDFKATAKLLNVETKQLPGNSVHCFYFATSKPPVEDPILVLNGDGTGPINNLAIPSLLSPNYAPSGKHLVSVSVLSDADDSVSSDSSDAKSDTEALQTRVMQQLREWFGDDVNEWKFLKHFHIPNALPSQKPGENDSQLAQQAAAQGVQLCGDYRQLASIQSAMVSGREAAEEIVKEFGC